MLFLWGVGPWVGTFHDSFLEGRNYCRILCKGLYHTKKRPRVSGNVSVLRFLFGASIILTTKNCVHERFNAMGIYGLYNIQHKSRSRTGYIDLGSAIQIKTLKRSRKFKKPPGFSGIVDGNTF